MAEKYDQFRQYLKRSIKTIDSPKFGEINKIFNSEIASLCDEGVIVFEQDYTLTGFALECRVKNIFKMLEFDIQMGRDGMEDFIINPPDSYEPSKPIVLEVKSSRKQQISRDQLRQLDDWVFELSGEQEARRYGLKGKGGVDTLAYVSHGLLNRESKPRHHPTPHKGVFIFNGSVQTSFKNRDNNCLSPNDVDFVNRRDFCILPFSVLVEVIDEFEKNPKIKKEFWGKIHKTSGILSEV